MPLLFSDTFVWVPTALQSAASPSRHNPRFHRSPPTCTNNATPPIRSPTCTHTIRPVAIICHLHLISGMFGVVLTTTMLGAVFRPQCNDYSTQASPMHPAPPLSAAADEQQTTWAHLRAEERGYAGEFSPGVSHAPAPSSSGGRPFFERGAIQNIVTVSVVQKQKAQHFTARMSLDLRGSPRDDACSVGRSRTFGPFHIL